MVESGRERVREKEEQRLTFSKKSSRNWRILCTMFLLTDAILRPPGGRLFCSLVFGALFSWSPLDADLGRPGPKTSLFSLWCHPSHSHLRHCHLGGQSLTRPNAAQADVKLMSPSTKPLELASAQHSSAPDRHCWGANVLPPLDLLDQGRRKGRHAPTHIDFPNIFVQRVLGQPHVCEA